MIGFYIELGGIKIVEIVNIVLIVKLLDCTSFHVIDSSGITMIEF